MSVPKPVRLAKFKFSTTTCFVMEFGHQYIRFYSNRAQVQVNGDPYTITSPYTATPGIPLLQTVVFQLQFCQIEDVIYITHPEYPVHSLTRISDTNWVLGEVQWLEYDGSQAMPPMLDQNNTSTSITPGPGATSGSITLTASSPIFDWLHIGGYWQLAQVRPAQSLEINTNTLGIGSSVSIPIKGPWTFSTSGLWKSTLYVERTNDEGMTWSAVLTVSSGFNQNYNIPGTSDSTGLYRIRQAAWTHADGVDHDPTAQLVCGDVLIYGLVKIIDFTSSTVVSAVVLIPWE